MCFAQPVVDSRRGRRSLATCNGNLVKAFNNIAGAIEAIDGCLTMLINNQLVSRVPFGAQIGRQLRIDDKAQRCIKDIEAMDGAIG